MRTLPPFPIPRLPERTDTVVSFIFTLIFIAMIIGAVFQVFPNNTLATVLGLIIVLTAAIVIVYVFVRLMTIKEKSKNRIKNEGKSAFKR